MIEALSATGFVVRASAAAHANSMSAAIQSFGMMRSALDISLTVKAA